MLTRMFPSKDKTSSDQDLYIILTDIDTFHKLAKIQPSI